MARAPFYRVARASRTLFPSIAIDEPEGKLLTHVQAPFRLPGSTLEIKTRIPSLVQNRRWLVKDRIETCVGRCY